jgi:pimeloyl-ACP methyl ester carboxylesterase
MPELTRFGRPRLGSQAVEAGIQAIACAVLLFVAACVPQEPTPSGAPSSHPAAERLMPCDTAPGSDQSEAPREPPGVGAWSHVFCIQLTLERTKGWPQTVQAVVLSNQATDPLSGRKVIVYHPGGPGFSVVRRTIEAPPVFDPDKYVVVAWDGNSAGDTPGPCGPASIRFLTERTPENYADLLGEIGSECRLGFGSPADVGAWAAAEELEAVRDRLGVDRLVLFTQSYGTTIAEAYLALHPDRVERAVLDAPLGLDVSWTARLGAVRSTLQRAANDLAGSCRGQSCRAVLDAAPPDAMYRRLREAILAARPRVGSGSLELTPIMLDEATLLTLKTDRFWDGYAGAVEHALGGDGTMLWQIGERSHLDLDLAAYYRSICADLVRPDAVAGYRIGDDPLLFAFTSGFAPCVEFPHGQPRTLPSAPAGAPEVLVVASTEDPFSPESMIGRSPALKELGPTCVTHVVGHTSYSDAAVRELVVRFIAGESAEAIGKECAVL